LAGAALTYSQQRGETRSPDDHMVPTIRADEPAPDNKAKPMSPTPRRRSASSRTRTSASGTASAEEIARFAALAETWWDTDGPFRPLHRLNPVRVRYIRDHIAAHFGRDPLAERPLDGLDILDIGCGGGLLAEPLARLGARVTGIDAAEDGIRVAALHAQQMGLDIDYRSATPESLADEGRRFHAVTNMEVVEHVTDLDAFLAAAATLMAPGGAMAVSTINRTLRSLALAKIGAEYVLRWVPAGTHDWRKFVKPSELAAGLRPTGPKIIDLSGMIYDPLRDQWFIGRDVAINYMAFAVKRG